MKKMLNAHISKPTCTIEEWMQKQHTPEEIAQRLRLVGKAHKALFDTDSDSKDFSAKELSYELETKKVENQSTCFEKDKLKAIADAYRKVKETEPTE